MTAIPSAPCLITLRDGAPAYLQREHIISCYLHGESQSALWVAAEAISGLRYTAESLLQEKDVRSVQCQEPRSLAMCYMN
jgi:hypothetical protein